MSSSPTKFARRRRKPTDTYYSSSNAEERLFQQALKNSRIDAQRPSTEGNLSVPLAPTFFPTVEEFKGNPIHYINKIQPIAEKYGICKIVPPPGWDPPFCVNMNSSKEFQTKEQQLHRVQEGISFGDGDEYNVKEYLEMAQAKAKGWIGKHYPETDQNGEVNQTKPTPDNLEREYWHIVENLGEKYIVDYGNDVDTDEYGSGFPLSERGRSLNGTTNKDKVNLPEPEFGSHDFYKETFWNLNNIPNCEDSILQHIDVGINGINVPWMYFGNLFTTFCWHNEDNYLFSINYHHWGAPKQWYGIPGKDAEGLEGVFKNNLPMKVRKNPDLLHHITTMFSPKLLQDANVLVHKVLQHPGEFVITFPQAFHGGFSLGPNAGEAVNFGTHHWISRGAHAIERYRSISRPAVFSHDRLVLTIANHCRKQKSYHACKLLLKELQRIYDEEISLRKKVLACGIRDVTKDIRLPKNNVDVLDEKSADYDDKRMCHACKYICFFSCVACECSQTRVSCLKHSEFMCRCPPQRKYLMVWTTEEEMKENIDTIKRYVDELAKDNEIPSDNNVETDKENSEQLSHVSPGSEQDSENHKGYIVDVSHSSYIMTLPKHGQNVLNAAKEFQQHDPPKLVDGPSPLKKLRTDEIRNGF